MSMLSLLQFINIRPSTLLSAFAAQYLPIIPPLPTGGGGRRSGSRSGRPPVDSSLSQAANAQLGIPLPLMYGYCRIRGDNILLNQLSTKNRVAFYLLGQGPFDGIERLWINKQLVNISDTTLMHFHPGTDGVLGSGLVPSSNGGDQKVDNFFNNIAANYQTLTYSRIAYLAVNVPPDAKAPDATLDVVGDYRTSQVRVFDSSGNQTAFQFSTNGAWQVLDLILRKMLNPEWTVAAASGAGGDLTAAQKARINWPAVVSSAQWCDTIIGNGQKRFESSLAITQTTKMQQALVQMLTMSQLYITEEDGQIYILPDQPRGSTFILTSDHVVSGTLDPHKQGLRGAANRLIASFNDLNPTDSADIDTPANNGLVRSSNVVTVKTKVQHPYLVNDNVQIVNPDDSSFAGVFPVASVPDNLHFTYAQTGSNATSGDGYTGTPESRFAQRGTAVDHEKHQNAIGARGLNLNTATHRYPLNITLGNNTMERVMRILNFIKARNLGLDVAPYQAPWQINISAYLDAVDSQGRSLAEQLVGDVITIDATVSEEYQGLYEIRQKTYNLHALNPQNTQSSSSSTNSSTSGNSPSDPTVELQLLQYSSTFFSDVATIVNGPASSPARGDLPPAPISDNLIRNGDFDLGAMNWRNSLGSLTSLGFVTNAAGVPRGSSYAQLLGPSSVILLSQELLPIDFTKSYLVEAYITTALGSGATAAAGIAEYDINRSPLRHTVSGDFNAWALGVFSSGFGWKYLWAVISGNGGSNPSDTQFNQNAAYMTMSFFLNTPNAGDQIFVCGVRLSEVAAGAKAAVAGLQTASGQLKGTFKNNPVNSQSTFTGSNPLSQSGTTTTINVAANTQQFGDGQVSYNSGSVNPGSYGTWYVYADDPSFSGGTVTYQATSSASVLVASNGRVYFGKITTASGGGGAGTGGGAGGGCPLSGAPVRLYGDAGWWRKRVLPCEDFIQVVTESGRVGIFSRNDRRYSNRGLLPLTQWRVGDGALTEDGEEVVTMLSELKIPGASVDSYEAEQGHIYSAWGFVGHNFKPG